MAKKNKKPAAIEDGITVSRAADIPVTDDVSAVDPDAGQEVPSAAAEDTAAAEMTADTQAAEDSDTDGLRRTQDAGECGNVFLASLEHVTADDFAAEPPKSKKSIGEIASNAARILVFWAAVAVFLLSGYHIVYKLYAYRQAEDIYSGVADTIINATTNRREDLIATALKNDRLQALVPVNGTREDSGFVDDPQDTVVYNELFEMMKRQLALLRNTSEDLVGWIIMEGDTEINYPIVQYTDNDYYLHYAYDGTYNPAGSIFLDYRNEVALSSNLHTIIYGHNMESGSPMFANLLRFHEDGFWENNRYISVYTADALYKYEVFSAYESPATNLRDPAFSWRMNFNQSITEYTTWIEAIRAKSDFKTDIPIDVSDRILTLSTCMNINENRYVVHCVLVEVVQ